MAVVQDRDKACSKCKQIPPLQEIVSVEFEIWSNLQELEAGVRDGCPFCNFIFQNPPDKLWRSQLDPNRPISLMWNGGIPFMSPKRDVDDIRFGNTSTESFSIFVDSGKACHFVNIKMTSTKLIAPTQTNQ